MRRLGFLIRSMTLAMLTMASIAAAQSAPTGPAATADPWCRSKPEPAFCNAVRGVRASGWPEQSRSEVMAVNGMVVASQPLAAQAGLQVLLRGGNAVDAAVAAAGVLSITRPMMGGVATRTVHLNYIAQ